jgi:hypothetical protein
MRPLSLTLYGNRGKPLEGLGLCQNLDYIVVGHIRNDSQALCTIAGICCDEFESYIFCTLEDDLKTATARQFNLHAEPERPSFSWDPAKKLFRRRKADIRAVQKQRSRVTWRLQGLFEQKDGLHQTGFARAIRPGEQGQGPQFDLLFVSDGLEAAHRYLAYAKRSIGHLSLLLSGCRSCR